MHQPARCRRETAQKRVCVDNAGGKQRLNKQMTTVQIEEEVAGSERLRSILDMLLAGNTPPRVRTADRARGAPCALAIVCSSAAAGRADNQGRMARDQLFRQVDGAHLREVLRVKCRQRGDLMQTALKDYRASFQTASWESIYYSSTPVTASMVVKQFWLVNIFLALGVLVMLLRPGGLVAELLANNVVTARHFRFKAIQLRAPDLPIQTPGLGGLSLMRDGCTLPSRHTRLQLEAGPHAYLSSAVAGSGTGRRRAQASVRAVFAAGDALSINGFGWHTPVGADPAHDAVEFELAYCVNLVRFSPTPFLVCPNCQPLPPRVFFSPPA